jgi:hypothetical protein
MCSNAQAQLLPEHSVVFVEGNYVLLYDTPPWDQTRGVFASKWFVWCAPEVTRERVLKRHIQVRLDLHARESPLAYIPGGLLAGAGYCQGGHQRRPKRAYHSRERQVC